MLITSLIALLLPGCATVGTLQTANTIGKGKVEGAVEPSVWGAAAKESTSPTWVGVDAALRVGVADNVDLGLRGGTCGFELMGKAQLTPDESPVIVSLAPSAGGFGLGIPGIVGVGVWHYQVPLLFGVPFGDQGQLVVAPKFHAIGATARAASDRASIWMYSAGGSVGYAIPIGSGVRILPEVSAVVPLSATGTANELRDELSFDNSGVLYNVGVGLLLGKGE